MNEVQEKSVVSYAEFAGDLTELVNEIHTLATPVLQAVSFYKERTVEQVPQAEKLQLQSEFMASVEHLGVHDVLDAIDGIEVLTRALQQFIAESVEANESTNF